MDTKLTLTIDQSVVEKAKEYAKIKKRSLSDLVENYLKILATDGSQSTTEFTPVVKSLKGSFRDPQHKDYKQALAQTLSKKYL